MLLIFLYKSPEKFILPPTSNLWGELATNSLPMATLEYDNIPFILEVQFEALIFSVPSHALCICSFENQLIVDLHWWVHIER